MNSTILRILVIFAAALLASAPALAQSGGNFALAWSTIDGGGGTSTGGVFAASGTIGQPAAGAMSGGPFTVSSGFWGGITEPLPRLFIRLGVPDNGTNTVILSWPHPSTGYVLQQSANMSAPGGGWEDAAPPPVVVGPNQEVTLPATGQFCIFRLRRL